MQIMEVLERIFVPLLIAISITNQCFCVQQELFHNSAWNDATILDFIEDDIFFEIISPEELGYTYRLRQAKDFGGKFKYMLKGVRLVMADPADCCSIIYNSYELDGAVALVTRGECSFLTKTITAETAGAIAVIVMDSSPTNDDVYVEMVNDQTERRLQIPAAFLLGKSGFMIKNILHKMQESAAIINIPVNLTSVPIHRLNQPPWIVW